MVYRRGARSDRGLRESDGERVGRMKALLNIYEDFASGGR